MTYTKLKIVDLYDLGCRNKEVNNNNKKLKEMCINDTERSRPLLVSVQALVYGR